MEQNWHKSERVRAAADLLEELLQKIVRHPDTLRVNALVRDNTVWFDIHAANPTDSKRIVGRSGAGLKALRDLASLMLQEARVEISEVRNDGFPSDVESAFVPKEDWGRESFEQLLESLATVCWPEAFSEIKTTDLDRKTDASEMRAVLQRKPSPDTKRFGLAIGTLFLPAGLLAGRRLYADVEHVR